MKTYLLEHPVKDTAWKQRGVFYILSEQGLSQRVYWLGYQYANRSHHRRITKDAYMALYRMFGRKEKR